MTLFVAREDGKAMAMGALRRHPNGVAEVKRMYTTPEYRGRGIGGRILSEIEAMARREGLAQLVLETGNNFDAALRVYARGGFQACGPVLDYPPSPYTAFFVKPLSPRVSA
jgi:putative acetyltransferase